VDTPVPLAASAFDLRELAGYDHQDLFATRRRGHRAGHQRASWAAPQSVAHHGPVASIVCGVAQVRPRAASCGRRSAGVKWLRI